MKRKKNIGSFIRLSAAGTLICCLMLSGCFAGTRPETAVKEAGQQMKNISEKDSLQGQVIQPETEHEKIRISLGEEVYDWIAEGFANGDKVYFRVKDNQTGRYGLADEKGNLVIPMEYDSLLTSRKAAFGYRTLNGQYHNEVYNDTIKKIFEWDSPEYRIYSCNDGVASFLKEGSNQYIYRDLENAKGEFIDPSQQFVQYVQGSVFNNGYALVLGSTKEGGLVSGYGMNRKGEYRSFYFTPGFSDYSVPIMPMAYADGLIPISGDYWINYYVNPVYSKVLGLPTETQFGFHNLATGQTIPSPEGYDFVYNWVAIPHPAANTWEYQAKGYALWASIPTAENPVQERKIYDLVDGRFASEESFQYIGLDDLSRGERHILVQRMDGTWGWLSDQFKPEYFYEDASSFYNGYALITDEGKTCVIDDDFHIVSDPIQGDGCFMLSRGDSAIYAAVHDPEKNGYHVLTIYSDSETADGKPDGLDEALRERVGSYLLTAMTVGGVDIRELSQESELDLTKRGSIELKADGTGKMTSDLQLLAFRWDGEKLYSGEEAMLYNYQDGKIEMNYTAPDGVIHMEFSK